MAVPKKTPAKEPKAKAEKAVVKNNLEVAIYDVAGKVEKKMELPKEIFSVEASPRLLAQYVRVYLANQRQGNASTKTRSEVIGSTRKIYRQKGTGRARHGAKKAPIFVGGGITFGPQPRDFSLKMNKKQKRKALLYSLTLKAREQAVSGFSNKFLDIEPKTHTVAKFFQETGFDKAKILLVLPTAKNNLHLAARNIPNVDIAVVTDINPYIVMQHSRIIFSEDAIKHLVTHFAKKDEN